jgi:hypothetical protein
LRKAVKSELLEAGTKWHRLLELYHGGLTSTISALEIVGLLTCEDLLVDLMTDYCQTYPQLLGIVEHRYSWRVAGVNYIGVIDLVTWDCDTEEITIWDHKLCSSSWSGRKYLYPSQSSQLLGYAAYLRSLGYRAINVGYNLAFKSGKGERFRRLIDPVTDIDINGWVDDLSGWIRRIALDDTWPRNRGSCRSPWRCEYLELCDAGCDPIRGPVEALGYIRENAPIVDPNAKAWRVEACGIIGFYAATKRSKAKYYAAKEISDVGYGSIIDCLKATKVYRAPDLDEQAKRHVVSPGTYGLTGHLIRRKI